MALMATLEYMMVRINCFFILGIDAGMTMHETLPEICDWTNLS